ncbi:MAG: carbohydrate binding domain-containing protein, partial [Caldilineaceae bacterium]|nr:carbohydrate binding domain-containing protein [Caldilineaceae bacterium]
YYLRLPTFTPAHSQNQSDLWSDYSEVIRIEGGTTPTNLLQNGSFESGTAPWIFFTNGQGTFTTAGPAYAGNAAARVEIIETGSNTQLYQTGFVLEARTRYRLRFAAYSSSGHDLSLYVQQHQSPYTNYGLRNFRLNLTTGWQEFSVEFRTKNFTMPTDDTRLRLWFKPYATGGDVYWIDNIVLEKIDARSTTASTSGDIVDTIVGAVQLPVGHTEPITLTLVDLETEGETLTRTTTTAANGAFQFTDLSTGIY